MTDNGFWRVTSEIWGEPGMESCHGYWRVISNAITAMTAELESAARASGYDEVPPAKWLNDGPNEFRLLCEELGLVLRATHHRTED